MSLYKQNKKMLLIFILGVFFVLISSINITQATTYSNLYFSNDTIKYTANNLIYTNDLQKLKDDFIEQWKENKMPITLHYYSPFGFQFSEDQEDELISDLLNYISDETLNETAYNEGDYIAYNYTNLMRRELTYARPINGSNYFITIKIGKPISKTNKTAFINESTFKQHETYIQQVIDNFIKEKNLTSKSQYDIAYTIFDYISHTMEFSGDNGEVYELLTTNQGNSHAMSMLAYRIYKTLGINDVRIVTGSRKGLNQEVVYGIITKLNGKYYIMDYGTESLYYYSGTTIKEKNSFFAIGTNSANTMELSAYFTSSEFTQQYSMSSTDYPTRPNDSSSSSTPSVNPSINPSTTPSATPSTNPSSTPSTNPSANTNNKYSIVISNKLVGNQADLNDSFTYTISFPEYTGTLTGIYSTASKGSVIFNSSTSRSITLKHNETFTISNVPENTRLSIKQNSVSKNGNTYTSQRYRYTGSNSNHISAITNTISITQNTSIDFTNENSVNVETGVVTKVVPFAILSVGAIVCLFFIFKKKKD